MRPTQWFPALSWLRGYGPAVFTQDLLAAMIVTILLIPQSLAYALLADLPPHMGLMASIMPLIVYALLGTSRTLSVGPVAVISLMTATAIGGAGLETPEQKMLAAGVLALLSGGMMSLAGFMRLGVLANYISHPVAAGFVTASALLIALGQVKHLLGVSMDGHTALELAVSLGQNVSQTHLLTLGIGGVALVGLYASRAGLKRVALGLGVPDFIAGLLPKMVPLALIAGATLFVIWAGAGESGVQTVGRVEGGLPRLTLPWLSLEQVKSLLGPAALISAVGFVESLSVGQTLGAKRRESVSANHELVALGGANVASALSGGFPVTGGFSRSVVNFEAGAQTQMASVLAAVGIALASLFLTPLLFYVPKAVLAATIIVAVLGLVDLHVFRLTARFSKADFTALVLTVVLTLAMGVEVGLVTGIAVSVLLHLAKSVHPHVAEVGLVAGTEHFRNILRHDVQTRDDLLTLRLDESLYFANAKFIETDVSRRVAGNPRLNHVVLQFSAINSLDTSALESLIKLNERLEHGGVQLHLSEVKGPVMDRLQRSTFLEQLTGRVFLSQFEAFNLR